MLAFLAARAIPGVEAVAGDVYRRTIMLDGGPGLLEVGPGGDDHLLLRAHLPYWEGLMHVVERVRRLLGLDVDPTAAARLANDPIIGSLVRARPGLRVPGAWAPFEIGVCAVISQRCEQPGVSERMRRLVRTLGPAVPGLPRGLTHCFPAAEVVATADLEAGGLSPAIADPVRRFARAVVSGDIRLDGSVGLDALIASVTSIPGIESTAAHHLALRLGERDAFPHADPSVLHALRALDPRAQDPAATAGAWRPWRSLAATHLLVHRDTTASASVI
jgi:AraC family transcriptional regulator of adaptative response / DNA-3-methyladenine glycosylase II